jgi:hypothetical protein
MPLANTQIGAFLKGDLSSALDLVNVLASLNLTAGTAFDNGTSAGQVDKMFSDTRTLSASSSEDLDLTGTLVDAFGATITMARIKGLLIRASAGNTNNVIIGANIAANAWATLIGPAGAAGGTITLRPGAFIVAGCGSADATGWAVTAGTGDLLHITNSAGGTSVSYDVVIIGCSA